jgi:hypothetical protein
VRWFFLPRLLTVVLFLASGSFVQARRRCGDRPRLGMLADALAFAKTKCNSLHWVEPAGSADDPLGVLQDACPFRGALALAHSVTRVFLAALVTVASSPSLCRCLPLLLPMTPAAAPWTGARAAAAASLAAQSQWIRPRPFARDATIPTTNTTHPPPPPPQVPHRTRHSHGAAASLSRTVAAARAPVAAHACPC